MKPIVAIIGRANVGKSRLFNRIVGRQKALVDDAPGITRDRHYASADWCGKEFIVVDTGGLEIDPSRDIERLVTAQSLKAVLEADIITCVFDGQVEPAWQDKELIKRLKKSGKLIVFAINKIDKASHEHLIAPYAKQGISSPVLISAEHGRGVDDLLDEIVSRFPQKEAETEETKYLKIAIIGRPNVGKSTLINRLAGEERVVAHEMPGTTRDAIDVEIAFQGRPYIFIDTAGIKKSFRTAENIEKFSSMRALRVIDRSDIVCEVIDANEGLTHQDLHLAGFVREENKGMLLLVNKWDLAKTKIDSLADLRDELKELHDVPILSISAKTGYHCLKIFEELATLEGTLARRVKTADINRALEAALASHNLPAFHGRAVKIYYATQTGANPPTFTLFANYPEAIDRSYKRYLVHRFKNAFDISGVPVRLIFRKKT